MHSHGEGEKVPEVAFRSEDRVFTTITGEPAKSLYQAMIEDLLIEALADEGGLRVLREIAGPGGLRPRP